jgi:release factor glutamine methyltransferase
MTAGDGMTAPTLAQLARDVGARLRAAGVPSPDADAVALIAFACGSSASETRTAIARGDEGPSGEVLEVLGAAVSRRLEREPLQHITGRAPFRTLDLEVGPGVFVPRPETELIAGAAIEAIRSLGASRAADLCAGSGAIALSLASETPVDVWAVELDRQAVPYLERNRDALPPEVAARVTIVPGDARTQLRELDGTFDVIAANPPYIPGNARPKEPEVELFDPQLALYGLGPDGLEVPRGIVAAAARLLRPGGFYVMEHGAPQAAQVREILEGTGAFASIETHPDLAGWDRFVTAIRV